ncbi:hypothetical protein C7212DRAFT_274136 [Tuber magnatum]|uniref:WW domain-containing protein n=1 Tax=Tuber magnatum TaxID=42249 RepID=A0A317T258_9PEZI|nr:hypothetical protein C7212DRAFT_274136 [Tuber magnatum]
MASPNLPNRPPAPASFGAIARPPPLAPGWTEHKAPTGHAYYYNVATKTSTYSRPVAPSTTPPFAPGPGFPPQQAPQQLLPKQFPPQQFSPHHYGYGRSGGGGGIGRGGRFDKQNRNPGHRQQKRQGKPDRPRSKREILGMKPWVLVTTKQGRKFVHNTETKASLWMAPEDVQTAIDAMPPEEGKPKTRKDKSKEAVEGGSRTGVRSEQGGKRRTVSVAATEVKMEEGKGETPDRASVELQEQGEDEEEGEEESEAEEDEEEYAQKRLKTSEQGPVEFTEDDVAWQLEAMAQEYGLDEEDLGEGEEMTDEDNTYLFKEMLAEYKVNPYSTWEKEMSRIVEDPRYVLINTTKARKEVFTNWCRERIAELKIEKEKTKKQDPRIPFWEFLKGNASAKLYWPEFKRKWKKSSEMKDSKVPDKDKEKMYREYISHMKISETLRENDLKKLLKSTATLSHYTTLDTLPESILLDVRYVTAPDNTRDKVIQDHLATLPEDPEEEKERKERERREQALRGRERAVRKEQWKLRGEERRAKEMLREEEAMIERAKVVGKRGLLGHIIKREDTAGNEKGDRDSTPRLDEPSRGAPAE